MTGINRLTRRQVELAKLPPGKSEVVLYDGGGLQLRLRRGTNTGLVKMWMFVWQREKRRGKLLLGTWPGLSKRDARAHAARYREALAQGIEPRLIVQAEEDAQLELEKKRLARHRPRTLEELFQLWDKHYLSVNREDGGAYVRRMLQRHVVEPGHGSIELRKWTLSVTRKILRDVDAKGLERTSQVVRELMRQLARWALQRGMLDSDATGA